MTAGDTLRNKWGRGDALVLHAISDIVATRKQRSGTDDEARETRDTKELGPGLDRFAFIVRSLKTQDELATLRAVYGPRLVVTAAYSPKEERIDHVSTNCCCTCITGPGACTPRLFRAENYCQLFQALCCCGTCG